MALRYVGIVSIFGWLVPTMIEGSLVSAYIEENGIEPYDEDVDGDYGDWVELQDFPEYILAWF